MSSTAYASHDQPSWKPWNYIPKKNFFITTCSRIFYEVSTRIDLLLLSSTKRKCDLLNLYVFTRAILWHKLYGLYNYGINYTVTINIYYNWMQQTSGHVAWTRRRDNATIISIKRCNKYNDDDVISIKCQIRNFRVFNYIATIFI